MQNISKAEHSRLVRHLRAQNRVIDPAKFQASERSTGSEDAVGLLQNGGY